MNKRRWSGPGSPPYLLKLLFPALVGVAMALTGCGGGGGSSGSSNPIPPPSSGSSAPVAISGTVTGVENTALNSALSASDVDGDVLTYTIVINGSKGTAVITNPATGAYTYTPNPNTTGTDKFTFKVNDGTSDSNIATITINIAPGNQPPVAFDGCSYTPQPATDGALPEFTGTLRATDPESSPLTFQLVGGGAGPFITARGGTVNITDPTTGVFSYKPKSLAENGDRGLDTFAFQAVDPDGAVGDAVQSIIVNQTIMPLGDSITVGDTNPPTIRTSTAYTVGYRRWLNNLLVMADIGFDLVGSQRHGTDFTSPPYNVDIDHEGHGGWTAAQIANGTGPGGGGPGIDGIYRWLTANPSDFVLLHIGTNGLSNDIEQILDEIDRWELNTGKHVTVLLALIIDWAPVNPDVTTFNQNVKTMAQNRIAAGDDIVIVDQQNDAGLIYQLTADGGDMDSKLHPSDNGGYPKMAALWFDALKGVMDQCP